MAGSIPVWSIRDLHNINYERSYFDRRNLTSKPAKRLREVQSYKLKAEERNLYPEY